MLLMRQCGGNALDAAAMLLMRRGAAMSLDAAAQVEPPVPGDWTQLFMGEINLL